MDFIKSVLTKETQTYFFISGLSIILTASYFKYFGGKGEAIEQQVGQDDQEEVHPDHTHQPAIRLKRYPHSKQQVVQFTLLFFNDVYEIVPLSDKSGGLAEMCTLMKHERERSQHCYCSLNGDFLSASTLARKFKGKHMIDVLNAFNAKEQVLDGAVLGNHEFDWGREILEQRMSEANFEWFGANVVLTKDKKTLLKNCKRKKIITLPNPHGPEIKIGMFGVCTPKTKFISLPGEDVTFLNEKVVAQEIVDELKEEGCDIIVAITHLSMTMDRELAKAVEGIDVIIGGHDHWVQSEQVRNTFITKAGQNASRLCRVDLNISKHLAKVQGKEFVSCTLKTEFGMISNTGYHPDPDTKKVVDSYISKLPSDWHDEIGALGDELDSQTILCRSQESTMGNLLADALRKHLEADLTIINGGTVRGDKVYPKGSIITCGDLKTEFPFGGKGYLCTAKGSLLLLILEDALKHCLSMTGGFPQMSKGVAVRYDSSKKPGQRLLSMSLHGKPIDKDQVYKIATTDYLLDGRDSFDHFLQAKRVETDFDHMTLAEHAIKYVKESEGLISSKLEDRIVDVDSLL